MLVPTIIIITMLSLREMNTYIFQSQNSQYQSSMLQTHCARLFEKSTLQLDLLLIAKTTIRQLTVVITTVLKL